MQIKTLTIIIAIGDRGFQNFVVTICRGKYEVIYM